MFDGRMPAKYADQAPKVVHTDDGNDVWTFNGAVIPNIGLNAVAGRPEGGVRRQPDGVRRDPARLLRHPRAHQGHERGRRARDDELPVVPCVLRPAVLARRRQGPRARGHAGVQRLAHRRVGRHVSRPRHPDGAAGALGPGAVRGGDATRRQEGMPLAHLHREPGRARSAELPRPALGPAVARAGGGRDDPQHPPRLVGEARGHRARRADGRDDHAAADEHLHGGRRPRVVARLQGVPRHCVSRSPKAGRAGSRTSSTGSTAPTTCTTCGRAKTSATGCRPTSSASTSSRASSPTPSASRCATRSASTTSAGSRTTRTPTRRGRTHPRSCVASPTKYNVPDADLNKMTHENAMRWYRFDPVRAPAEGAVHRRRVAGRGRRSRRRDPADGQGPLRERPPRSPWARWPSRRNGVSRGRSPSGAAARQQPAELELRARSRR